MELKFTDTTFSFKAFDQHDMTHLIVLVLTFVTKVNMSCFLSSIIIFRPYIIYRKII